jgi:protein TonB
MNFRFMATVFAVLTAHGLLLWALDHSPQQPHSQTAFPPSVLVNWIATPAPAITPAPISVIQPSAARHTEPTIARPSAAKPVISQATAAVGATVAPREELPPPAAVPSAAPGSQQSISTSTSLGDSQRESDQPAQAWAAGGQAKTTIELPSNNAAYLDNPPPRYTEMSRRLGEQGQVIVVATIGIDGRATQAEVLKSSGYTRLDQSALSAVDQWRFIPGKRNGVPAPMKHQIPITFTLR